MKHNYPRYGLATWPESQDFLGEPGCILVNPPANETDPTALDSSCLVPESLTGPLDEGEAYARIPWPESQKWLNRKPEDDGILRDYDSQDAYVLESLLDKEEEKGDKPKRKFEVTLYFHTNVTVTVEAENEEAAVEAARGAACGDEYTKQLLEGLQEDDSPDATPVKRYVITLCNMTSRSETREEVVEATSQREAEEYALSGGLVNRQSGWGVLSSREAEKED